MLVSRISLIVNNLNDENKQYFILLASDPELIVAFRGTNPSFLCNSTGTTFWHINKTLYDFRGVNFFAQRGIEVQIPDLQGQPMPQSVTVMTDKVENNNTELRCTVLDPNGQDDIITHNASLYIIGECCH